MAWKNLEAWIRNNEPREPRHRIQLPNRLRQALAAARAVGCTDAQIGQRVAWFVMHQEHWPWEHRPGALHDGIADATPDLPANEGWPFQRGRMRPDSRDPRGTAALIKRYLAGPGGE